MKKFALLLILPFLFAGTVTLLAQTDADAARLGGGRSFGSKPSYNRSAPSPQRQASPAQQKQQPGAQQPASGPRSGMGGFFGPLLAGSILGALIFGGGFAGVGLADFLLLGLVLFVVFRLFRRRQPVPASADSGGPRVMRGGFEGQERPGGQEYGRESASDPWARLRSTPLAQPAGNDTEVDSGLKLPSGFDLQDFLSGAKAMFARLQKAWDQRDMEDLSMFVTPAMIEHFRRQYAEDPEPSNTDILLVDAKLVDFETGAHSETASVFFKVLLREDPAESPHEIREIWHFTREKAGDVMWRLDGLQQVQ